MTPEAARDKKLGFKMQTLRAITCSGTPQSSKRRGHEWPPKASRNTKLGVIFAKCAPITPSPLLVQPLQVLMNYELSLQQTFLKIVLLKRAPTATGSRAHHHWPSGWLDFEGQHVHYVGHRKAIAVCAVIKLLPALQAMIPWLSITLYFLRHLYCGTLIFWQTSLKVIPDLFIKFLHEGCPEWHLSCGIGDMHVIQKTPG